MTVHTASMRRPSPGRLPPRRPPGRARVPPSVPARWSPPTAREDRSGGHLRAAARALLLRRVPWQSARSQAFRGTGDKVSLLSTPLGAAPGGSDLVEFADQPLAADQV